jgi:hypothetical protein
MGVNRFANNTANPYPPVPFPQLVGKRGSRLTAESPLTMSNGEGD